MQSIDLINSFTLEGVHNNNLFISDSSVNVITDEGKALDFAKASPTEYASNIGHMLTKFTHEVFFKCGDLQESIISSISESPGNQVNDRRLYIDNTVVVFYIFDGSERYVYSETAALTGDKFHIICTADGTNIKIYVNGKLEDTTAAGDAYTNFSSPELVLGYGNISSSQKGGDSTIYYHRVYKEALSAAEIASLYKDKYQFLTPVASLQDAISALFQEDTPPPTYLPPSIFINANTVIKQGF